MNIKLSVLEDAVSVQDFLIKIGFTKSFIKKFEFPKAFLQRPISRKELIDLPINFINRLHIGPEYVGPSVKILFEDQNFLVFSKPIGVHSHPIDYLDKKNVLSFMRSTNLGKYLNINCDQYDRGLLHRLDQVTSGVLVYVKNSEYFSRKSQDQIFKKKMYLTIVEGKLANDSGQLQNYLENFGPNGKMVRVSKTNDGLWATLSYQVIAYNHDSHCSLVLVELHEGRRHQIRVQLSEINHPILGDTLYGGKVARRVFLHSFRYDLSFNNKDYSFMDSNLELFDGFFDLNSCLQVIHDKLLIS